MKLPFLLWKLFCCSSSKVYVLILSRSETTGKIKTRVTTGFIKKPAFLQLNGGLGRLGSSTSVQSALFNSVPHSETSADQSRSALWLWMLFRLNDWVWIAQKWVTGVLLVQLLGSVTEKCSDIYVAQETNIVCDNDVVKTWPLSVTYIPYVSAKKVRQTFVLTSLENTAYVFYLLAVE